MLSQTHSTLAKLSSVDDYPSLTKANASGRYEWVGSEGWTSGFWPGLLWQLANATGDDDLWQAAARWTAGRVAEENNTSTHDVGFMVYGSFGVGLRMWDAMPEGMREQYIAILARTAGSLAERYNPLIGMTRSWGSLDDQHQFEVIIDNLMNLELLFWVAGHTSNTTMRDMAISHAQKTGQYWIRPDGSTYHLVVFDPQDGHVISRSGTPQGLAVNSTWARGQAWAIYGFTMAYRYTHMPIFLQYALNVTHYWAANVPTDQVPKWDFLALPPDDYRDTSAAAIACSAFYELYQYTGNVTVKLLADNTLRALSQAPYLADPTKTAAVLSHTAHDCGSDGCTIIESDYYFLEALRHSQGHWP